MGILRIAAALALVVAATLLGGGLLVEGAPYCQHTYPDTGNQYDFTAAASEVGEVFCYDSSGNKYLFVPCGLVDEEYCQNPQGDQSTCFEGGGLFLGLGKRGSAQWQSENNPTGTGFTIHLTDGDGGRTSTIKFVCNRDAPPSFRCDLIEDADHRFTFTSKYGCPTNERSSGGDEKSGGLAGGWIFIICLVCVTVVYLVGGVLWQKYKKEESGWELIPNLQFWKALPGLVWDGCKYTGRTLHSLYLRLRGGGGDSTYQNF
ncbi:Autophagy-related protein 27 [Balamuthia mandrillaris]